MNGTPNTDTIGQTMDGSFYIDAEGNRVEIPFDTAADFANDYRDGEAASAETKVYIAADEADHPITVH